MKVFERIEHDGVIAALEFSGCLSKNVVERMTDGRVSTFDLSVAQDVARGVCSSGAPPKGAEEIHKILGRRLADGLRTRLGDQGAFASTMEAVRDVFPHLFEKLNR